MTQPAQLSPEIDVVEAVDSCPEEGWRASLGRVFAAHRELAFNYAAKLAGRERADEVVSDALASIIDAHARSVDPLTPPDTDERMKALLLTAIERRWKDGVRKEKREERVFVARVDTSSLSVSGMSGARRDAAEDAKRDPDVAPDDAVRDAWAAMGVYERPHGGNPIQDLIAEALEDLSRGQEEVVWGIFFAGESREDIAIQYGISVRTVDAHLQAAYRKLRDYVIQEAPWFEVPALEEAVAALQRRHMERRSARRQRRTAVAHRKTEKGPVIGTIPRHDDRDERVA